MSIFDALLATERKYIFPPQKLKHAAQWLGGRVGAIILEQPLEPVYKLGARSQIRGATLMLYVPLVHLVAEVLWVILCFRIDGIDDLSWMCWKLVFVDVFVGSLVLVIL